MTEEAPTFQEKSQKNYEDYEFTNDVKEELISDEKPKGKSRLATFGTSFGTFSSF